MDQFSKILTVVFGFFILIGLVAFSTYRAKISNQSDVKIVVWGTISRSLFDDFISTTQKENNIKGVEYVQKSADTIDNDLLEAIATGKAPDSVLLPQHFIKRYLDKIYFIDYKTLPERTFKDTFVQEAELYLQPKGIVALPLFVDPLVMYWNRDMFSNAGISSPPAKWSEFPILAEKISQVDKNANVNKSAVAFGEYKNVSNAKALLSTFLMQVDNPIVFYDNTGKLVSGLFYSDSDTKNKDMTITSALNFFVDYSNPKKSVYSWNRSMPFSKQSFLSENLATYFGFASEYTDIKDKNPNLNFDIAMIPQPLGAKNKTTFGELYGFMFLKSSKNFVTAYSTILNIVGYNSVPYLLKISNTAPARRDLISSGADDPIKDIFYKSALISKGWIDPNYKETDKIFQDMIENITTGNLDLQDSARKADEELNNLLK